MNMGPRSFHPAQNPKRTLTHRGALKAAQQLVAHERAGIKKEKNPRQRKTVSLSESAAWNNVTQLAAMIPYVKKQGLIEIRDGLVKLAEAMRGQVKRGMHTNPALGILMPNPGVVKELSSRVYEIRYRHRQDGRNYFHPFTPGVRIQLLSDGSARLYHPVKRIWRKF